MGGVNGEVRLVGTPGQRAAPASAVRLTLSHYRCPPGDTETTDRQGPPDALPYLHGAILALAAAGPVALRRPSTADGGCPRSGGHRATPSESKTDVAVRSAPRIGRASIACFVRCSAAGPPPRVCGPTAKQPL